MNGADGLHLLTFHGSIVCVSEDGRLVHRPVAALREDCAPALWHHAGGERIALNAASCAPAGPRSDFVVRRTAPAEGVVHLQRGSGYLRATPDGMLDCDVDVPQGWEQFRFLSAGELRLLRHLLGHAWIVARTREIVPAAEIALLPGFRLRVGTITAQLGPGLPLVAEDTLALLLFVDGWKVEELRLFRPLIYFTIFRRGAGEADYLRMTLLSIRSFEKFLGKKSEFLIITNIDRDEVLGAMPNALDERLHIFTSDMSAHNIVDIFAERYKIAEWHLSSLFQPLLYTDSDVLCNNDISSVLRDIALGRSIMVGEENWSPPHQSDSVGASLFAQDIFDLPTAHGFNSGVIGIPNVAGHRLHLRAIVEVIQRYASLYGRESLGWFDQACANYVSAKLARFDGSVLTKVVEHIGASGQEPQSRTGLLHFWGAPDKIAMMRASMAELESSGNEFSSVLHVGVAEVSGP